MQRFQQFFLHSRQFYPSPARSLSAHAGCFTHGCNDHIRFTGYGKRFFKVDTIAVVDVTSADIVDPNILSILFFDGFHEGHHIIGIATFRPATHHIFL
ncbi:hypothetical protein SDC9_120636 [bioreactor metagenome]|uniref:Uncharacterized protein n=1 Tax=bioreactor metagenome TaxID=1076179 RepID=A0A645C9S9_9ZZZZ